MFRTAIGFDDAYVAAPSRKAALAAWGAGSDLFAAGVAEVVTDPALMAAALERPGEVVRRSRGSAAEQIRALGVSNKKDRPSPRPSSARSAPGTPARFGPASGRGGRTRARRPSSAAVDEAEAAIARAEERHRAALAELKAEAEAIDKRRRELERKQRLERGRLEAALDQAREEFRKAMDEWAG